MKKVFLTFLLLMFIALASVRTICGYIKLPGDTPLAGVELWTAFDGPSELLCTTDENGFFYFETERTYSFFIVVNDVPTGYLPLLFYAPEGSVNYIYPDPIYLQII
jgi:hypothetical protein